MRNSDVATTQDQTNPENQVALIRHILPVALGLFVVIALTLVTASWLTARGIIPPLAVDTLLRAGFLVLGSHLAARVAPAGNPRIRYGIAVGAVITLLNLLAASSGWGRLPNWYLIAGIVLPIPCAIVGGGSGARAVAASVGRAPQETR